MLGREGTHLPRADPDPTAVLSRDGPSRQSPQRSKSDEELLEVREVHRGYGRTYKLPKDLTTLSLTTSLTLDLTAARRACVDLSAGPYVSRHASQETCG